MPYIDSQAPLHRRQSNPQHYGFAGHETFPFRYSWLKKAVDAVQNDPNIFSREDAIVTLGVGKNMVSSIRHWGLATQMLTMVRHGEGRNDANFQTTLQGQIYVTSLGQALFNEWDPYLEDPASLWLIHYLLVTNPRRAAVWNIIFMHFHSVSFTKERLCDFILRFIQNLELKVSPATISRDVECFIRTYTYSNQEKQDVLEDSLNCPLSELGIVQHQKDTGEYHFVVGPKISLPVAVFTYALCTFHDREFPNQRVLSVDECLYHVNSPGQTFKLDENTLMGYLESLSVLTNGVVAIDETAGVKQVYFRDRFSAFELLANYYFHR